MNYKTSIIEMLDEIFNLSNSKEAWRSNANGGKLNIVFAIYETEKLLFWWSLTFTKPSWISMYMLLHISIHLC